MSDLAAMEAWCFLPIAYVIVLVDSHLQTLQTSFFGEDEMTSFLPGAESFTLVGSVGSRTE